MRLPHDLRQREPVINWINPISFWRHFGPAASAQQDRPQAGCVLSSFRRTELRRFVKLHTAMSWTAGHRQAVATRAFSPHQTGVMHGAA